MAAVRVRFRGLHLPFCMQLQEVTSTYEWKLIVYSYSMVYRLLFAPL